MSWIAQAGARGMSGTPDAAGQCTFAITVTDDVSGTASANITKIEEVEFPD